MSDSGKTDKKYRETLFNLQKQSKVLYDNQEPYDLKPWKDLSQREKSREVARCAKIIKARRILRAEHFNQDEIDAGLQRLRDIKRHIQNMKKQLDSATEEYVKLRTLFAQDSFSNGPLASEIGKISGFKAFNTGGAIKDTVLQLGWMIDDVGEFKEANRPRTNYESQKTAFQMAYRLASKGTNKEEVEELALRIIDKLELPHPDIDTFKVWRKEEKRKPVE
ncbi:MAG: hypothetical protein KBT88_12215 [Gammaproteobacteria bacterium]|nr:hypothetical protein [Gammaproteobacteria bacterium]MBQ0840540.1 hypothetical protein [Gammaproteobacteria bacterium]